MGVLTHSQSSILSCWSISDTICKSQNLRICFLTLLNHITPTMAKYSLGVINTPYGLQYVSFISAAVGKLGRQILLLVLLFMLNEFRVQPKKKRRKRRRKLTMFYISSFHQWKSNTLSSKIIFFHPLVSFQAINTLKLSFFFFPHLCPTCLISF